jgi:hypothetical protein
MQEIEIPVRFQVSPAELPTIDNGWFYTVSLIFIGGNQNDPYNYTAWLVKNETPINQSQFLSAN